MLRNIARIRELPKIPTIGLFTALDANNAATVIATSGAVSAWNHSLGSIHDATQGTGSKQPTTGTVSQYGKNVLDFDGGDTMALSGGMFDIPNGDLTIIVVMKQDSAADERVLSAGVGGSTRLNLQMSSGQVNFSNNATFNTVAANIDETNWNIITAFKQNTTTQSISVNGGIAVTDAEGADISGIDGMALGSNQAGTDNFFNGSMARFLVWNRFLSPGEIYTTNSILSREWGVPLS